MSAMIGQYPCLDHELCKHRNFHFSAIAIFKMSNDNF